MKSIAIGLSSTSMDFLKLLEKTEFIDEIFVANSFENKNNSPKYIKPKIYLEKNWTEIGLIVFIGSIGAATRLISTFLTSKDKDPGVIVMNKKGSVIVPLIGAHQANIQNIALELSNLLNGEVIETSNSSVEEYLNIDSFGNKWGWERSGLTKDWSSLVIRQSNQAEIFYQQEAGNSLWKQSLSRRELTCINSDDEIENLDSVLQIGISNNYWTSWHPPVLWIGIGCERNTDKSLIEQSLSKLLSSRNLSSKSIAGFATIDIKKDETALLEVAKDNNRPIKFFGIDKLSKINVPNPSQLVKQEIGTPSVAEAACLLAAGENSILLVEKNIFKNATDLDKRSGAVTIAIAKSSRQFAPSKGEIHIIGSGPGNLSYLTNDARQALSACPVWIGYSLYLDLLQPLQRKDQIRIDSKLTEEKDRCAKAISLAEEGIKVALISSGDAGIYGMAGLVLELLEKVEENFRPNAVVHPGISSMQLAASLAGAPLMNDFCVINLSDKLTAWEIIEKRIIGAISGDFVVSVFNPQSQGRQWQLKKTIEMFLNSRKGNTPVLLAREVGREKQSYKFYTLETIPINEVDMLSILIIGNSKTKLINDKTFISPRGYL